MYHYNTGKSLLLGEFLVKNKKGRARNICFSLRWDVHILAFSKHHTQKFKSFVKSLRESTLTETLCVLGNLVDYLPGRGRLQQWPGPPSKPAGICPPDPWWWDESQSGWERRAGAGSTSGPSWQTAANQLLLLDHLPACALWTEPRWAHCTRNLEEAPVVDYTD